MDRQWSGTVPAHHKVREAIVIDGGDVAPNDDGVDPLLVEVNGCEALEASVVIPEEAVYPEQANHAVVAEHLEHIAPSLIVIAIGGSELLEALLLPLEDLRDHGLLDQRLEVVEDTIDIPRLHISFQDHCQGQKRKKERKGTYIVASIITNRIVEKKKE